MPGIKDTALSRKSGFQVPGALRAAAQREVARVRASRSLFARIGETLGRAARPESYRPRYASRASYYKHCKAALMRALSPFWQGSHAELKARVREILHPRRRDVSLLSGLLRATTAPALLAVFMLAASAPVAQADTCPPSVALQAGAANPFNGLDAGLYSTPAFADLDGDGDQDAVVGHSGNTLKYYLNTGTPSAPTFSEQTGTANPFNGVPGSTYFAPTFGDLDGDGDQDAVIGKQDGAFRYFRNTGTVLAPVFSEQTGVANPFNGFDIGNFSMPALGDVDGDGDLDVISGTTVATITYFRNTGTPLAPAFSQQTGAANPFNGVDVGAAGSAPAFTDFDGDGDQDAIVGDDTGNLNYFKNTGSALAPVFVLQSGASDPFNGVDVGSFSAPAFADLDGDGDQDTLIGKSDGAFGYYKTTSTALVPAFSEQTGAADPFNGVSVGTFCIPALADLDGDGDQDALVGDRVGAIRYYQNSGSAVAPVYSEQTGAANPFDGVVVGSYSALALADLDGDGDQDAVVGDILGAIRYYQNSGTALAPAFSEQTGAANPFNGVDVGSFSLPAIADLDGDGDKDAIFGHSGSTLKYYQNTGTAIAPAFSEQTGAANPFDGLTGANYLASAFADLDGDGDQDAVVGKQDGGFRYYRNTGTALAPVFSEQTGAANPLNGVDVGSYGAPAIADLDGDGDMDALIGRNLNSLVYFSGDLQDSLPPVISRNGAATVTVECGGTYTDAGATASDACEDSVVVTVGGDTVDTTTPGEYIITYNATDGANAAIEVTRTVTVQDTIPPDITLNGDAAVTVECGSTYTDDGATASDTCASSISVTVGGGTVDTATPGEYTITYNATDGTNAATEVTRTVTVQDTTPPDITVNGGAAVTVECGGTYTDAGATASDTCEGTVSVTVGGDTVDTATPGDYTITYNATDGTNAATEVTRTVTVQDTTPPDITLNGDAAVTVECGGSYTDEGATASDICEGTVSVTVGGDTVDTATPGEYTITYNATDGTNAATEVTRTVTVQDTTPPDITLNGDAAVTVECGGTYTDEGATASDTCEGTVSVTVGGDTVDTATPGEYTITYNATDGTNAATEVTRTVTVQDTTPPDITLGGDAAVTVECGGTYSDAGASASDTCAGTVSVTVGGETVDTATLGDYIVTYNATDGANAATEVIRIVTVQDTTGPEIDLNGDAAVTVECGGTYTDAGATASDTCTGNVSVSVGGDTVDTATPGEYTITYNATDGTNAATEVTRTVTVQDTTPPDITLGGDSAVTVECGSTYTDEGATASDTCEGTVSVTVGGDTVDTATPGEYTITYNATDGTNPATEVTRTVTVQDTTAPVITLSGDAVVALECSNTYTDEGATASDDCEGTVSVTVGGDTVNTAIPGDYTITYNATDGTNAAIEVTRTVTVQDTTPPEIELIGDVEVTVECGGTYTEAGATMSDDCNEPFGFIVGVNALDTNTPGNYIITYSANDGTNPVTEVTRTVTVQDTTGPVITLNGGAEVTVECGTIFDDSGATAIDTCAGSVGVTVGGDTMNTATPGVYTITYNATDGTNPAIEVTRTVTVQDTTAPVIELNGDAALTVGCGSTYTDAGATASDGCNGAVSVIVGGDSVDTATPGDYTITYNATDGSNSATEVTRVVTVLDDCPVEGEGEGILEGEGVTEGEGEGLVEGEGATEGEGAVDTLYEELLRLFATGESTGNTTLTLAEIQSVLPGFTQQDVDDADYNGDGELSVGELLQRVGGGILVHADTNGDYIVQLTELLRLIQLYNAAQYACAENAGATEDGFALTAPPSEPACVLHSADQNGDKVISLSELLRGIQLYNLSGYTWCPDGGTEDGFCG